MTKVICIKQGGFKKSYRSVAGDYILRSQWGTGEFELDEQDKKLLAAWPGEIIFRNGDNTPVPVGFVPKSWDDPKIKQLWDAGFAVTIDEWVPFRPKLSDPPPHLAPFYNQIGLTMENGTLCYKRDFITRRAKYDGRELIWPQEGFQVTDYFDHPCTIEIHK